MSTPVTITTGQFVLQGFLAKDLLASLRETNPSLNAQTVRNQLKVLQNCDFKQQLVNSLVVSSEQSLSSYIRQYVRNNSSDTTQLPAMERYYINKNSDAQNSTRFAYQRNTTFPIAYFSNFETQTRPADFFATKTPPWNQSNGIFSFTRKAKVKIKMLFNVGLNIGGETESNIQWRYANTGANRLVTITPTIHLAGALSVGSSTTISLPPVVLFPEHYKRNTRVPVHANIELNTFDPDGSFGRIDSLYVSLQRSTWIAKSSTGTYDTVGLYKKSATGILDTSNYLEFTEL